MHIVFHRNKMSFSIIEMKLRDCITLKKHLRKAILLYTIVTVSCGTYLGIDQSMIRKFVSSPSNTRKSHMFGTAFVICSYFFGIF